MAHRDAFKSYDVRGRLGVDLDDGLAHRIGRAFAIVMDPGTVVVGRDVRASSPALAVALTNGLRDGGVDVIDIGLCGTEEVYFATEHLGAGGGLMVTASHNPIDHNGIKMVQKGARPISGATGLDAIRDLVLAGSFDAPAKRGGLQAKDPRAAYVDHVLGYLDPAGLAPLRIVVNAGNGAAGPTFDALANGLHRRVVPFDFVRLHHEPNSGFPNGIPNPLLPENRPVTGNAVIGAGADLGVAWDGDFDRCFFFDEKGRFIDGEYVVALLAQAFLAKEPGAKIVHDPRVMWNTVEVVRAAGGVPVASQTGHAHLKAKMREVDAVYGGEMSAHHYFRRFMYCDSGMIPALLVAELLARSVKPLSAMVAEMQAAYPSSGEINFKLANVDAAVAAFEAAYVGKVRRESRLDGISLDMGDWRVNLRRSNTEALLRLNIETRGDRGLLAAKVDEVSGILRRAGKSH